MVSSFFGILTKGTVRAWNITYFKFDFFGKKNRVNEIGFAIIFYGQQKGFWKALFYVVSISAFLFFVFSCYDLRASFHATIYALPWPGAVQRHRDHSQHNQREIRGARSGSLLRSRRALRDIPKKRLRKRLTMRRLGAILSGGLMVSSIIHQLSVVWLAVFSMAWFKSNWIWRVSINRSEKR